MNAAPQRPAAPTGTAPPARTTQGARLVPSRSPGEAETRFDQAAGAGLDGEQPSRLALTRGPRVRAPLADRGDEERAHLAASECGHRRLLDGQVDAPIDGAARRDPEHRPAVDAGDPVAAVLVDARPIGAARGRPEVAEN